MYSTEVKVVGLSFRRVTTKLVPGDKVKLVPEPDNKFDPNALQIQSMDGEMIGYVGKKDPLRLKMLAAAQKQEVTLPVLIAQYYEEGDKLWESLQPGDMVQLWLRALSRTPIEDNTFSEITSFTGEKVLWSEYLHICTDMKGNELLGGSTYAAQFEQPFDSERIAGAYAKKRGLSKDDVLAYWKSLGDIASNYGTSIHSALEHYNKSYKLVGHDAALPRQAHLRTAVEAFLYVSDFDGCVAEPLLTDVGKGMSGWVDNLRFTGAKTVIIEDYKTNTFEDGKYAEKWPPKKALYWRQLSYYGTILQNHGYTVAGLVIWHWHGGKWDKYTNAFISVKKYEKRKED